MHTTAVVASYLLFGVLFAEAWIRIRDRVADWLWGIQQGIDTRRAGHAYRKVDDVWTCRNCQEPRP